MSGLKLVPYMKSELDYWAPQPCQYDVERVTEISYSPITTLDKAPSIEFLITGDTETYRDLSSTFIRLLVQLDSSVKVDAAVKDPEVPGVVNNIIHSLFRQVSIYLNNTLVSQEDGNYHYRAYLESLFHYSEDAASTQMQVSGWYLDAGSHDPLEKGKNEGLDKRKELFKGGKVVELIGRVHGDIINQSKYIPNGVDIRFVFHRENPAFYMLEKDDSSSEIKILDANLFINHIHVNHDMLVAHQKMLDTGKNMSMMLRRVQIKQFTVNMGQHSLNIDNICFGRLPNMLLFGLVLNEAYSSKRSLNPFNFRRYGLQSAQLVVNGVNIPSKPLELCYSSSNGKSTTSARAYQALFRAVGMEVVEKGHQITKERFDTNFFFLAFDLSPDHAYNDMCMSQLTHGNIRIEGKFEKAIEKPLTCIVMLDYDGCIEIDSYRNITNVL